MEDFNEFDGVCLYYDSVPDGSMIDVIFNDGTILKYCTLSYDKRQCGDVYSLYNVIVTNEPHPKASDDGIIDDYYITGWKYSQF
jgi:hypothetical protein